ncbi:MAG TPA: DUF503 domain-containing protein [Kofleriaceae bacterium]|nr:DUF503 domain-containing protein [Kofleriaceae bacterium]
MLVGVLRLSLSISGAHSLKEKRGVIQRVKERVRNKLAVSVAEVGAQDLWQRAQLGFAVVASARAVADTTLTRIIETVEAMGLCEVCGIEREVVDFGQS